MTNSGKSGFTIVEVLVAMMILTIGVLALAGGAISITRNLHRSRTATSSSSLAAAKIDELRSYAKATQPNCTSGLFASSAGAQITGQISLTWVVPASGILRNVQAIATYRLAGGVRADTVTASIAC
jgi:prepilin-type N-terminal cleavage/methylation domain-containing protein